MSSVTQRLKDLYGSQFEEHGDDPQAFLHAGEESQHERFRLLCELFRHEAEPFTVHEIGCSLGHFGKYLAERFPLAAFSGSDVYAPFVETCREAYPAGEFFVRDISETLPDDRYDYLVTCGTYNIANDAPRDEWNEAVCRMATAMYEMANKGFGMTFLTTYHDPAYAREDLYYQSESALMELV